MFRSTSARPSSPLRGALLGLLLVACGGGGGGGSGFVGTPGTEFPKPGGGTFFLDAHGGGSRSRIHLLESTWGRLVDVHGLDANGIPERLPAFRDLLIRESVQTLSGEYRLETNPITQETRLVILRQRGAPDTGTGTFESLLALVQQNLAPLAPKSDDGSSAGPFSLVARNACLALHFDDLLEDGPEALLALQESVRVLSGYPPDTPVSARILFDPNHGGLAGERFHSTRVLVDFSVSSEEASESETPLSINPLGLPPSGLANDGPNAALRLPTRIDPGSGQYRVLTNLSGSGLDGRGNGPVDTASTTLDVVRAFRTGRSDDENSGFLLDLNRPELVGAWPVTVDDAAFLPSGTPGFDLLVDLTFASVCRRAPRAGDILQVGERVAEILRDAPNPTPDGTVSGVEVSVLGTHPVESATQLLGSGSYQSTFTRGLPVPFPCWLAIVPPPSEPPDRGLRSDSTFLARFSEPMSPGSVDPFESFRLARGNSASPLLASSLVVANTLGSGDLSQFTLRPLLPLPLGLTGEYHLQLAGGPGLLTDLAGNTVVDLPGSIDYQLAADQDPPPNSGLVMRFNTLDELPPIGFPDLRGQAFYDLERGLIRGRSAGAQSFAADRTQPVPSIMIPFAPGVQTPLSGMGSKLQFVWRYCDLGWQCEDESRHNLDVVGLSWTPVGGVVSNDFFPRFEMRLSHSRRIPDEFRTFNGTSAPCSGLGAGVASCFPCLSNVPFEDNILRDPRSPQVVVHDRSLGYRIDSRDIFVGTSGARLLPFPMNHGGGPFVSFLWRDTAVLTKDGEDSVGIPLQIETSVPLSIDRGPPGRVAIGSRVPAWGLPLLVEVRCFPSSTSLGLNPLEIYLAQNAQQLPNFRAYTTGGTDETGTAVLVDPDLSLIPRGAFNPTSRPPGKPTAFDSDNSFYAGQLDTLTRVSRAHTAWMEISILDPHFAPPVVFPPPSEQPGNARVELEFRGADAFFDQARTDAFDASKLDPMGDVQIFQVQFHRDDPSWTTDPSQLDGARYLQMRISFVNDIQAALTPELSAVGIAFTAR